jgi:hypothetical protein
MNVVFHFYKVGVGFTSPREPMHHLFGNNVPHIKLWAAPFQNYPVYFGQSENGDQRVLSGYASSYASFIYGFSSITPLFSVTPNIYCI